MRTMRKEEKTLQNMRGSEFYGIRAVIKGDVNIQDDGREMNVVETVSWDCCEDIESRSLALKMCRWPTFADEAALKELIERIEQYGNYERAACVAVFHLRIRLAIEILNKGAKWGPGGGGHEPQVVSLPGSYPPDYPFCSGHFNRFWG
ncbi:putative WD repeat-containing protein mio [Apostichopus japonicus]|uniref:Putative WD repeat-containing protein mio n=1 Tax=Stichopus japonicus TaxID=307972 RepID=A0A2G8L128_STIJA|nr:putative WD repeat-containing protein mio [Apostichopus japonicus]